MNQKHQEDLVKLCSFLKDPNLAILKSITLLNDKGWSFLSERGYKKATTAL